MKTLTIRSWGTAILVIAMQLLYLSSNISNAQTYNMTGAPYSLSPKWYFGNYAGLDLTSGSPVFLNGNRSTVGEGASTITDRSKNVVMYVPGAQVWMNGAASYILNNIGGTSSTQGATITPDPADPDNFYYVFTSDDQTGGMKNAGGIWYWRVSKTGIVQAPTAGTQLAQASDVNEAITVGVDDNEGYWLVSHSSSNTSFYVWHITASGISGPDIQPTAASPASNGSDISAGGPIKFNLCQNKIAFAAAWSAWARLQLFNWDNKNGKILSPTSPIVNTVSSIASSISAYGLELSPNDKYAYISDLNTPNLYQVNLTPPGTWNQISSSSSNNSQELGGLQLGPDGKIYVTNGAYNPTSNVNIGVIANPNLAAHGYSATGFTMPATSTPTGNRPSTYEGGPNIAWLSPQKASVAEVSNASCVVNFKYTFQNYFNEDINTTSTEWSWDNGSTWVTGTNPQSHTFATGTNYKVKVRYKDASCNVQWPTLSITGTVTCTTPVDWLNITANNNGNVVLVNWATTMEKNNNYFEVQRSIDGVHFTTIGRVNSNGNSSNVSQYQFTDTRPYQGESYYRIAQFDLNGEFSNSNVTSTEFGGNILVEVSPNPSYKDFTLKVHGSNEATITVVDMMGREVYQTTFNTLNNLIFGENLSKGTYIVKVISDEVVHTERIVKQ